jgi:hypothetical protein
LQLLALGGASVPLTTAADLYAFGMIAAEMMLQLPLLTIHSIARDPAQVQRRLVASGCGSALADLVMHCLAEDPALRPKAADVVKYFERDTPFVPASMVESLTSMATLAAPAAAALDADIGGIPVGTMTWTY